MTSPWCACVFVAVLEPDVGLEHHRRSSSMRLSGTSYRSCIRERSSDDCIIGTHLGMGTPRKQLSNPHSGFNFSPATLSYDTISQVSKKKKQVKQKKCIYKSSEALIHHMQLRPRKLSEILPAEYFPNQTWQREAGAGRRWCCGKEL